MDRLRPTRQGKTHGAAGAVTFWTLLALGACGGPEFEHGGEGGSGGKGGTQSQSGGAPPASGGASGAGRGGTGAAGVPTNGGDGSAGDGSAGDGGDGGVSSGGTSSGGASSGGRVSSGGARSGGAPGSGGVTSGGGTGAIGGIGTGGLLGSGGNRAFPTTSVLDNFNREDGELGDQWLGATSAFAIDGQRVTDLAGNGAPIVWRELFGTTQEAFATFTGFAGSASEINLVLKAQTTGSCELIEVLFRPDQGSIGVDYCVEGAWTEIPTVNVNFSPGDKLGARATAAGDVVVYMNGALLATFNARSFPYTNGRIGLNSLGGVGEASWDDFGGGTVP